MKSALNTHHRPTETDALAIAHSLSGERPLSVQRFATGIGHWVYEVRGNDGSAKVVRMGRSSQVDDFTGAIHWSNTLRPLGVPLPELLAHGEYRGLPYLVLERLAGEDLEQVYTRLSQPERRAIAEEVCEIQCRVGRLPQGEGYGFVRFPGSQSHRSWADVVDASLARSRSRILQADLVSPRPVDQVSEQAKRFAGYFSRVPATPFLDDVTTKNVLVHAGRLSGIVDVDWICYGDSLFTLALTRAAILSAGANPDYTDHWCDLLALTSEQQAVVHFYTALFCVDFMSEFGQVFNHAATALDLERLARLEKILDAHLGRIKALG